MKYMLIFIGLFIVFFLSGAFFSSWFYRNRIRMLEDENAELRRVIANPNLRVVRHPNEGGGYQPVKRVGPIKGPPGGE